MYITVRAVLSHLLQGGFDDLRRIYVLISYFQAGMETIIEEWLMKKYEGVICRIMRDKKEDLKLVSAQ